MFRISFCVLFYMERRGQISIYTNLPERFVTDFAPVSEFRCEKETTDEQAGCGYS
jgi:hypothetical protein